MINSAARATLRLRLTESQTQDTPPMPLGRRSCGWRPVALNALLRPPKGRRQLRHRALPMGRLRAPHPVQCGLTETGSTFTLPLGMEMARHAGSAWRAFLLVVHRVEGCALQGVTVPRRWSLQCRRSQRPRPCGSCPPDKDSSAYRAPHRMRQRVELQMVMPSARRDRLHQPGTDGRWPPTSGRSSPRWCGLPVHNHPA